MQEPGDSEIEVPYGRVVRFLRQLSHDLRNQLNAAELQAAFLNEIANDAEVKDEVKRLRGTISELARTLQSLTNSLGAPKISEMSYLGKDLLEDLERKAAAEFADNASTIEWRADFLADTTLQIDPQALTDALLEILRNAFLHERGEGKISVTMRADSRQFSTVIREPKSNFERPTDRWGLEPFIEVGRGHYGLGLARARSIFEAHGGELRAHYDPETSALVTTVSLPSAP